MHIFAFCKLWWSSICHFLLFDEDTLSELGRQIIGESKSISWSNFQKIKIKYVSRGPDGPFWYIIL